jgi:hypothetical protein
MVGPFLLAPNSSSEMMRAPSFLGMLDCKPLELHPLEPSREALDDKGLDDDPYGIAFRGGNFEVLFGAVLLTKKKLLHIIIFRVYLFNIFIGKKIICSIYVVFCIGI